MTGPSATATPATPDQRPIASARSRVSVNTLVRIDSVAGMISAAPMPMTARAAISARHAVGERGRGRRRAEHDQPDGERALAPEAVAQAPGRQEQPGEDQRVGVDDPLQVADARAEVAHEGGEGDVDDRVVDDDHEQTHAEHEQREPAAVVDPLVLAVRALSVVHGGRPHECRRRYDDVIASSCYNDVIAEVNP